MRKRLKYKIMAGFMLLIVVLIVAGIISIIEFSKLSHSVNSIIGDNYKTIEASKSMLEALEREDSGILLLILGEWKEGRKIMEQSDSLFNASLFIARNNITEPNEEKIILTLSNSYSSYKEKWERPIVSTDREGDLQWYYQTMHAEFLQLKHAVHKLMSVNQNSMYDEATHLINKSHRAMMPGIVSILAALVFTLLLNFFISKYFISPITQLAAAVKNFKPTDRSLQTNIGSKDEIKLLESEINSLIAKVYRTNLES